MTSKLRVEWSAGEMPSDSVITLGGGTGNHLGKEPEEPELRPDDHQQHAQGEERPGSDLLPEEPEHRQVGIDGEARD